MILDILDRNIVKILALFSISPGSKFTRNEIKEKTLLYNTPLDLTLTTLINNNLLIKEKRFISLNWENDSLKSIIEIFKKEHTRFKELPLNIYFILLDISYRLSSIKKIENIFLFGSFAKLIHTEKSDVDLAIILKKENKELIKNIKKEINKIEKKYHKTIEEHFFEKKDLNKSDPLIKEIKRNNVVLF